MTAAALPYDDDRLPWLQPYREPTPRKPRPLPAAALAGGAVALAAAFAVAAYVSLHGSEPEASPVVSVIAPVRTAPVAVAPKPGIAVEPPPAPLVTSPAPDLGAAEEPVQARRRSPGPPGQVIQLGAFRRASTADRAHRAFVARYPLLRTMRRAVIPVTSESGSRTLYVLRLGTASRQQSGIVCRNLRASGDQCLVVG